MRKRHKLQSFGPLERASIADMRPEILIILMPFIIGTKVIQIHDENTTKANHKLVVIHVSY